MDSKQKNLLNATAPQMAEMVNFMEIAEHLKLAKLITNEKIEDIMESVESSFARNLKLFNALQESDSPSAFDDFVQILEITSNSKALKLIVPPGYSNKKRSEGYRGILNKLALKFSRSKSKSPPSYPLGMTSGTSDNIDSITTISGDSFLSPSRDLHQSNIVNSSSKIDSISACTSDRASEKQTFPIPVRGVPTADGHQHQRANNSSNTHINLLSSHANQQQNTTSNNLRRFNELRMQDLNISEHQEEEQQREDEKSGRNGEQEPVVCWHPYAQPQCSSRDSSRASSPHHCSAPSYASSHDSNSLSESVIIDSTLILDSDVTMAIAKDEANTMKLRPATVRRCSRDIYKMTANPRGICLIINNIDFNGDIFPTRTGSDIDAKRFDELFTQLFFKVVMRRNQTAEQMKDTFKEVATKCEPDHDALFVLIFSHGSEHGIYGVDGLEVYLESDIISCFDNRNCEAMKRKPKVFVIQACRGRSKDFGGLWNGETTDSVSRSPVASSPLPAAMTSNHHEYRVPSSWLPSSQPKDKEGRNLPIHTDMLLVFSCLAGFVSVRNETRGSWLGVALSYFIMTHAYEKDLQRILNMVTSDIIQRESSQGHFQSIEVKLLGWTKSLYFNPGL